MAKVSLEMLFGDRKETRKMQLISIGYGKATFSTASVTLAGFVVEPEFTRTLASKALAKQGSTQRVPVSRQPDINGHLFSDTCNAPDGTIILVQAQRKYRGSSIADGAIAIRTRVDGAMLHIVALIPSAPESLLSDSPTGSRFTVFSGCGDIVDREELATMGINVPGQYYNAFFDEEEVGECYEVTILREAATLAPKVETVIADDGRKVVLQVAQAARRMRVRRT